MVDFSFSDEEQILRDNVRDLLSEVLAPRSDEIDRKCSIPRDVIMALAENKLLLMNMKPEFGGSGATNVMTAIVVEELARADPSVATAVFYLVEAAWGKKLEKYGNKEVAKEVLTRAAKGEGFVGIASTEPQSGSDVAGFRTISKKENDHWVINGEKAYISGIKEAKEVDGGYVLLTMTKPEERSRGMTVFYLPVNSPGITYGFYEDMGRCGISTGWLKLKDVKLPDEYRIGEVNKGFKIAMEGFDRARVFVATGCIGPALGLLDYVVDYLKKRVVFGKPLAKFEGIQFPIVDHWAKLEAIRLLVYKAAWAMDKFDAGEMSLLEAARYSAMAKALAPEESVLAIQEFMRSLGAFGYTKETPLERALRGVMSYFVGAEGGQHIMRIILASDLFGREFSPTKD
jgi:acyl-CoA dehydrogenase